MAAQGWRQVLVAQNGDGTALTASTTPTSIIRPECRIPLPGGFFAGGGKTIGFRAAGRISTVVTTPGTLTLDIRLGSTVVFNMGAISLNIIAQTNDTWVCEGRLTCRAVGISTTATVLGIAEFKSQAIIAAAAGAAGAPLVMLPATAPAVGTGFDSTAAQVVDLFATWSISNANSIQTHQYELWDEN